jgi:hypothetical protein
MSFKSLIGLAVCVTSTISLYMPLAHAQESTAQQLQDEAKQYSESMPTGSVPATNILGIADSNVPRVTNFKSIVSQLSQGMGADGKIKNALGFEAVPYLLANDTLDWNTYDSSTMIQILTRTTVSFAAVPASDGKTASSAFGAQSVFYSDAVKRARDAWGTNCAPGLIEASRRYHEFVGALLPGKTTSQPPNPTIVHQEKLTPDEKAQYDLLLKARNEFPSACQVKVDNELQAWNSTIIAGGLGWGFYSPDSNANTLKTTSSVYWITSALGWGDGNSSSKSAGLLTLHVRKAADERTPDPANANGLLTERSTLYGANLRYGSRKFGVLMEYSSRRGIVSGLPDENVHRSFLGMDAKIGEDLYLSWGVGSETGRRDGLSRKFALTNIKYAFGNKPVFVKGD